MDLRVPLSLALLVALPLVAVAEPKTKQPPPPKKVQPPPATTAKKAPARVQPPQPVIPTRPPSQRAQSLPREVVRGSARLTRRIVIIIDVSGSMCIGDRLRHALQAVLLILTQPTDDLEVSLIAFSDTPVAWPGVPEKGLPKGWTRFPSQAALTKASTWLSSFSGSGLTRPAPALDRALRCGREQLSVVLISDGEFEGAQALAVLKRANQERVARGLRPASLMTYGVGKEAETQKTLRDLGDRGRGGFWVPDARVSGPW